MPKQTSLLQTLPTSVQSAIDNLKTELLHAELCTMSVGPESPMLGVSMPSAEEQHKKKQRALARHDARIRDVESLKRYAQDRREESLRACRIDELEVRALVARQRASDHPAHHLRSLWDTRKHYLRPQEVRLTRLASLASCKFLDAQVVEAREKLAVEQATLDFWDAEFARFSGKLLLLTEERQGLVQELVSCIEAPLGFVYLEGDLSSCDDLSAFDDDDEEGTDV